MDDTIRVCRYLDRVDTSASQRSGAAAPEDQARSMSAGAASRGEPEGRPRNFHRLARFQPAILQTSHEQADCRGCRYRQPGRCYSCQANGLSERPSRANWRTRIPGENRIPRRFRPGLAIVVEVSARDERACLPAVPPRGVVGATLSAHSRSPFDSWR